MKLYPVAPEFRRFVSYFQDIERIGFRTLDEYHASALSVLDPAQKRRLLVYIETCLDGTHSEEELFRLWADQRPQQSVQPATWLFSEIRRRLLEEIEAGR